MNPIVLAGLSKGVAAAALGVGLSLAGCSRAPPTSVVAAGPARWAPELPRIAGTRRPHYSRLPGGAVLTEFDHTGSFEDAFAVVLRDLTAAGWSIRDSRGGLHYRAIAGCGTSCETQRFYAVTRASGTRVTTTLRIHARSEFAALRSLPGRCVDLSMAKPPAGGLHGRYTPVFDVDLDRDGQLDAYVPRPFGERDAVVWDAYVRRGSCGHRVGTFRALPLKEFAAAEGAAGLADLAVEERISRLHSDDGRSHRRRVDFRFDGTRYVAVEPAE